MQMKIKDIIDQFIAGDWGEETCSNEMPCAVTCVRGADIVPIFEYDFPQFQSVISANSPIQKNAFRLAIL